MVCRTFTIGEVNSSTKFLSLKVIISLRISIATCRRQTAITINVSAEVEQLQLITALVSICNTREVNGKGLRSYILLIIGRNCCTSSTLLTYSPIIIIERQNFHTSVVNSCVNLEATIQLILQDVLRAVHPP